MNATAAVKYVACVIATMVLKLMITQRTTITKVIGDDENYKVINLMVIMILRVTTVIIMIITFTGTVLYRAV